MATEDLERGGDKNRGYNNNVGTIRITRIITKLHQHRISMRIIQKRGWTSWLIPMFVVANIVMFIITMYINDCPKHINDRDRGFSGAKCLARGLGRFSFQLLKENPLFGPSSATLEKLGALQWQKVVHQNQGWRLFSCIWLHAGVIHVLANMLSLVFIGIRLEQQFGFMSSLLFFIRGNISVGASGALFGLLGAMLSELLTNWTIYANKAAALITLIFIIVINLAVGLLPHVDNYAHIGGFLTVSSKFYIVLLTITSFYQFGGCRFTVGLCDAVSRGNGNDHCSWCHYLSCVRTSRWKCDN
ncbi:hypothetical protein MKW92_032924 [Papaver armeniacum]|nr:hypothetical protein MKW92_032924 [Papaver armeniacum]